MKQLIILLLFSIGCNSNTATNGDLKQDTVKTDTAKKIVVIATDTTTKKGMFRISAIMAVTDTDVRTITFNTAEFDHIIDSIVSWKMQQKGSQDWITVRKDQSFMFDEINRLTEENLTKNEIIMALQDSIKNIHYLWVDPLIGKTVRGAGIVDSLIKQP